MSVLVTGAWGALGRATIAALRAERHDVVALDLPRRAARRAAATHRSGVRVMWADVRDRASLEAAAAGVDAVVHQAAVLPPATERHPHLARQVNVDATRTLLEVLGRAPAPPRLVYPSSVAAYGPPDGSGRPRRGTDPLHPTDTYTRHKAACEAALREQSRVPWTILRLGVAIGPRDVARVEPALALQLLRADPDTPLEWIHPRDAGVALARACHAPSVEGRILPIGGGPACRVRHRDLLAAFTGALGLPRWPDGLLGRRPYYTDWLDTEEGEALLGGYQRHTFDDLRAELRRALRPVRLGLTPWTGPLRTIGRLAAGRG